MHAISLPHVFQSDPNIRDGLGENLKSPKSSLGPRDMPLHGKGWAHPQSHAWEAEAQTALWFLIAPNASPWCPPQGGHPPLLTPAAGRHFHALCTACGTQAEEEMEKS